MDFKKIKHKIFEKSSLKRTIFFLIGDALLIAFSCFLGFFLRFDANIPIKYIPMVKGFIALAVPLTIILFAVERLYAISWSFISLKGLIKIFRAISISFLAIGAALFLFRTYPLFEGFPRSIIFISGFLTFIFISFLRFSKRLYLHSFKNGKSKKINHPCLIVGAGESGEEIVRHIKSSLTPYSPVGFVDDNPMKQKIYIHGVKVLGKIKDIPDIIKKENIEEVIIAMPSAPSKKIKQTVKLCREAKIQKIKIIPSTTEILQEKVSLNNLREISIEDLLAREKVEIDTKAIKDYITNKKVLITGAAGSIGSELCRQISKFNPKQIITIDQRESGTFFLEKELNRDFPEINKKFIIADVCNKNKIEKIFKKEKPDVVFHAAAYKHVPLMEENPDEAIKNNIFGTLNIAKAALENNIDKFVLISTDKAINPTSIMGASKRVCEMICVWLNQKNSTKFCAVRFGNVLGSQGSVVPVFQKQIEKGGPVEVTHPEMKRYFMVPSEACLLVMQAGAIGESGKVFILDMGQPVKILRLAKEMIKLAGYKPDIDIPITFSGIRPGEKLFEEISTDNEKPTKHEGIFIAQLSDVNENNLINTLEEFEKYLEEDNKDRLIEVLNKIVPIQR